MQYRIKILEKDGIEKIIEFNGNAQSDRIRQKGRPLNEFIWLFFNGPVHPAIYTYAENEKTGDIIGTQAGIILPLTTNTGNDIITIKGEDTLISLERASEIGRVDILSDLWNSVSQEAGKYEADFIWGFTPAKSAFKRCGFKIATQIKGGYFVIKPLRFSVNRINQLKNINWIGKLKIVAFAYYNILSRNPYFSKNEINLKKIESNQIDEKIINSFIPEKMYSLKITKDFLNWRIDNNPSGMKYHILEVKNKTEKLLGYFILSYNCEGIWNLEHTLLDKSLNINKRISIIRKVFRYSKTHGSILVRIPGFDHNEFQRKEMKLYKKAGTYFFKNPEESYFVFKNLTTTSIEAEDLYLSRLFTQGIR